MLEMDRQLGLCYILTLPLLSKGIVIQHRIPQPHIYTTIDLSVTQIKNQSARRKNGLDLAKEGQRQKGDCSNKLKLLELNKVISYLLQVANIYYYPSVAQHKAEQIGNLRMYYEGTQMQAMRSAPAFLHNTPQVTSS